MTEITPLKKLTVGICTHDRAVILRGALQSLCEAQPPEDLAWEVVVALNSCTDKSAAVVEEFAERLPIRAVEEPRVGLSNARNKVIETAIGDGILWMDDDVRVRRDWLRAYERALRSWPETSVFGGPIQLLFEGTVPEWLRSALPSIGSAFAIRTVAEPEGAIFSGRKFLPFGANFAIRTNVQKLFPYDPDLGRIPGKWLRGGEETAVICAIIDSGRQGRWVPSAVVDHLIPPARQTVAYIRAYYEGFGRSVGEKERKMKGRRGAGHAIKDMFSVLRTEMRYRVSCLIASPEHWARDLRVAARTRGRWIGQYVSRADSDRQPHA